MNRVTCLGLAVLCLTAILFGGCASTSPDATIVAETNPPKPPEWKPHFEISNVDQRAKSVTVLFDEQKMKIPLTNRGNSWGAELSRQDIQKLLGNASSKELPGLLQIVEEDSKGRRRVEKKKISILINRPEGEK